MKRRPVRRPAASSALLAAAVRGQTEGVFIAARRLGPRGFTILFANDSLGAMTGYAPGALTGQPHGALHTDATERDRIRQWLAQLAPGRSFSGEGYVLRRDGSAFYGAWTLSPVFDRRGRATHIVAVYRDITEKRELQDALAHAQRLDAVGRLAGGVAHDFNNLISVINGYCEILAPRLAGQPEAAREVQEIHHAGQQAAALTRQLLAFGRRQPTHPRTLDLNAVVQENAGILARVVGDAGELAFELAPDAGCVRADPLQLQQVLLNLVLNARDALRDHGRIVIATARRDTAPGFHRRDADPAVGPHAMLSITDNGTGMDAHTQQHLFEPFFTTKPHGKGTGLGLALVYGIVQQNGGYIQVRSAPLAGSTFELFLPAVAGPATELPALSPVAPPPTERPAARGHEPVLLIESDEVVRKMLAGILTADGYRVTALARVDPALADDKNRPHPPFRLLILSAGGKAETFARRLHARSPGLRLLRVSNHEPAAPWGWLPAAHQAALTKPFALNELLKAARRLLDA